MATPNLPALLRDVTDQVRFTLSERSAMESALILDNRDESTSVNIVLNTIDARPGELRRASYASARSLLMDLVTKLDNATANACAPRILAAIADACDADPSAIGTLKDDQDPDCRLRTCAALAIILGFPTDRARVNRLASEIMTFAEDCRCAEIILALAARDAARVQRELVIGSVLFGLALANKDSDGEVQVDGGRHLHRRERRAILRAMRPIAEDCSITYGSVPEIDDVLAALTKVA